MRYVSYGLDDRDKEQLRSRVRGGLTVKFCRGMADKADGEPVKMADNIRGGANDLPI